MISRKLGLWKPLQEHPINALWARFTGVRDWDGHELRKKFPCWAEATKTARGWATNHLVGLGWWCWIIPLKGGDVSIGLVYDNRLFQPPEGGTIGERLQAHFQSHPVGREILGAAQPVTGDQRAYSALPYFSEKIAGDGWVLAGDSAGFIDPLYSPGLDFCSFTAHGAQSLVARSLESEDVHEAITSWNDRFAFCYRAWFESIYKDKYYYLGDAELMAAAFLHDIATYHLGPVRQVYSDPSRQFDFFPFDGIPGQIVHKLMRFFNRRLTALAQRKLAAGVYGNRNADWRLLVGGFLPDGTSGKLLAKAFQRLLVAELRCAFLPKKPATAMPGAMAAAALQRQSSSAERETATSVQLQ